MFDDPHPTPSRLNRLAGVEPAAVTTAAEWFTRGQDILIEQVSKTLNKNIAKNIIFFIGDGMSIPTFMATRTSQGNENIKLAFERLPYTGFSKTYCEDYQVPDSACTATAYLCGVKANFGTIGVSTAVPWNSCTAGQNTATHVNSIAKWAQDAGKATGLVTTTTVTHASPGGVYAHTANRMWENNEDVRKSNCNDQVVSDIAKQLIRGEVGKKLNVIFGGGRANFLPKTVNDNEGIPGARTDNINLIEEWKANNPTK